MKFNKKILAIHLLASVLMTEAAYAGRIQGVPAGGGNRGPSTPGSNKPSNPSKPTGPSSENTQTTTPTTVGDCSLDMDTQKNFPLALFNNITRDGSGLSFEIKTNNQVLVKVPAIINVCGKFTPELRQNQDTKNIAISMKLVKTETAADGTKTTKELSYKDFEDCLISNKIMVDGKIDHEKIPGKNYSETTYALDFDFDKKKDVKKSPTLSYAYPKAYKDPMNGYDPLYKIDETTSIPGEACMDAEQVAETKTYVNKGQEALLEEINKACSSGVAQDIANARRSIGNADALKDIADQLTSQLDAGYLVAVKKTDLIRIDAEMTKIEEKINNNKDMDEATAKKEIAKYAALAKELDTKFLNPAIYRLETLMKKRDSLNDPSPELKAADDEIKQLNEDIGKFTNRNPTSLASIYSAMEKYAINDSAKTVEDIRLKSYLYSKVYAGPVDERRGKPITFESANKQQYEKLQKFDKTLADWNDLYLVGKGNLLPLKRVEKERQASIDRMNTRWASYEKKEMKDYSDYCGVGMLGSVKNPVKCKAFVSGMDKRRTAELKKREKDLYYIKGRNERLERMGSNYNEYTRKVASREAAEGDDEPYGSSYTSYEDNFADSFPGYTGPTTTTAYDPAMYNMGGMSNSMNMGAGQQQLMRFPANQQVQNGQFQMQQPPMQQGGWPSM